MSATGDVLDFEDERLEDQDQDNLDVLDDGITDEEKDRARRMGWADEDHFRGDKSKWVDARTFLKKGEEMLPVLRERLRKQDDDIKHMREELHQVVRTQGEFERTTRERVEAEFEERKRQAVEQADTDAYDAVYQEERKWREKQATAQPNDQLAPRGNAILEAWKSENEWFETDPELTEFADDISGVIIAREPHLKGTAKLLDKIAERTKRAFPDKFQNPRRDGSSAVEGATGPTGGRAGGRKKTYNDLPQAARAKCDEYVANNWVQSKEQYVADYFGEEQ
jgi:hypothetical protein